MDIDIFCYSLRPILLFANIDVSRHILVIDTSILEKSNMGPREYMFCKTLQDVTLTNPITLVNKNRESISLHFVKHFTT
jgi:hypothetical protein